MKVRETLKINSAGHLEIGGCDAVDLAKKYGTPLYVLDEDYVRRVARAYKNILDATYGDGIICYASKALCTKALYKVCLSEGLGADVASGGELYTALASGMDAQNLYFHSNNKTPNEIRLGVEHGVNFVIDSFYEIELLEKTAAEFGKSVNVLIRVNPGIDAHTHHYIQTARVDSKFGFSISDGAALTAVKAVAACKFVRYNGLHCHIGSQIFEIKPFELAVEKMTDFIKKLKDEQDLVTRELNMGGGYGVTYTAEDAPLKPEEYVKRIIEKLIECTIERSISRPRLILEPGRSIVGEAGVTLYTAGAIKDITGIKKYVAVDGGMFDNPRFALYQAKYEAVLANRANEPATETVTIAGKCCESGDILIENARLPQAHSGDIVAVLTTGAYNYSMASNYNRNPIPPMVMVKGGKSAYIVRPQTYEDMMSRDELPDWIEE